MTTKNVTSTDLKGRLAELVEKASRGNRLRVTRHGRVQVGIVSPEDLELLEMLEKRSDLREAARVRRKGAKPRPAEDVLRDLGL